jgi:hypothetical protein
MGSRTPVAMMKIMAAGAGFAQIIWREKAPSD